MPEPQAKEPENPEVDDRGVPLLNKMKELERKFQDKDKELAMVRQELTEIKTAMQQEDEPPAQTATNSKEKLMDFVQDPDAWYAKKRAAEEQQRVEQEFRAQVPMAETWIKSQPGYKSEDDNRIYQIIQENKIDTPRHLPMERAKTAWKILQAEKRDKEMDDMSDDQRRHTNISKTSGDASGKAIPKTQVTRADIITKLAEAELKGDLNDSVKYTGMLEDIRE